MLARPSIRAVQEPMTRNRTPFFAVASLLLIALSAVLVIRYFHWDQQLYYRFTASDDAASRHATSLQLGAYEVVIAARPVSGVDGNLSGITFDPDRRQLWAVVNGPSLLLGLSENGDVLSRHVLNGFHDVEGVVYLGDGQLALVEERRQSVIVIPVPGRSDELRREDFTTLHFDRHPEDNKEYEGLTYDASADRLIIAKERDPMLLYEVNDFTGKAEQEAGGRQLENVTETLGSGIFLDDIAGLAFDALTSHLVALSHESRMLVELAPDGSVISHLLLEEGSAKLKANVPQGEGVTLDDQGRLYVVSEPNLFYRFEDPSAGTRDSVGRTAALLSD